MIYFSTNKMEDLLKALYSSDHRKEQVVSINGGRKKKDSEYLVSHKCLKTKSTRLHMLSFKTCTLLQLQNVFHAAGVDSAFMLEISMSCFIKTW